MGIHSLNDYTALYEEFVLASGKVAQQGHTACLNTATGMVQPAEAGIATLLAIGTFAQIRDKNGITGDGSRKVNVRFPSEVAAVWRDNDDAPNNVQASDIGSTCYMKDGTTVTVTSGGNSPAGRVLAVDSYKGVLVQFGIANTGPAGASGAGLATGGGVADKDALSAIAAASRYDGMLVLVRADGSIWRFVAASTAVEDEAQELVIEPDAGAGRWLAADKAKILKLPISSDTADGDPILTVPAGFALRLTGLPFWQVTTGFTGGASSAIGVSTSVTGYTDKGDLLGGATGDETATLGTAGVKAGTLGTELDDHVGLQALALVEGDELQFDRITSAFDAGEGFVCVPVAIATV